MTCTCFASRDSTTLISGSRIRLPLDRRLERALFDERDGEEETGDSDEADERSEEDEARDLDPSLTLLRPPRRTGDGDGEVMVIFRVV